MSEFTDKDRERAQKTLTLLESHVKLSEDRHKEYVKKFDNQEEKIRKNTTFRNYIAGALLASGTGLGATLAKLLSN